MFTYFKIASAEDEHFRMVTDLDRSTSVYRREEFHEFSPEFLSVLYVNMLAWSLKKESETKEILNLRQDCSGIFAQEMNENLLHHAARIPTEYFQEDQSDA